MTRPRRNLWKLPLLALLFFAGEALPSDATAQQPIPTNACCTQVGRCLLPVFVLWGSPCVCSTPYGNFQGIACL